MKVTVIIGQTATGKTDLALKESALQKTPVLNFDSRQIYRKLNIVTGKDYDRANYQADRKLGSCDIGYYTLNRSGTDTHLWLYDIVDPKSYFSSFDYASCAKNLIEQFKQQNSNAVLVGGTYLYLYHLLYNVDTQNIPPNFVLRKSLIGASAKQLQDMLNKIDPKLTLALNRSELHNTQRLIRKLEIASFYKNSGVAVPLQMNHVFNSTFDNVEIDIKGYAFASRQKAGDIIHKRVEKRIKLGAIEETKSLLEKGYTQNDPGLRTIGYSQIISYLQGKISKEQAIEQWVLAELQYTKRQLTFMKKDPHIRWHEV